MAETIRELLGEAANTENYKRIRILRDHSYDDTPAVEVGTEVEAYITESDDPFEGVHEGEAWYSRPDTGEEWMSFPGDYEVIA